MSKLKNLRDFMCPLSWLFYSFGLLIIWIVVFAPTWVELVTVVAIDFLVLTPVIVKVIDPYVMRRLQPSLSLFFDGPNHERIAALSEDQRVALIEGMMDFPRQRALYGYIVSMVYKVGPGLLLIVLYWHHACSNLEQFGKMLTIFLIYYSYFYGIVYIENHDLVSRMIAEIHERCDLTGVFAKIRVPNSTRELLQPEAIALLSIGLFLLIICGLLVAANGPATQGVSLTWQIGAVGIAGMLLAARLWYANRSFLFTGLDQIFRQLETFDPKNFRTITPLHSYSALARFEMTFNQLIARLIADEHELESLVLRQTDKLRYESLGEISGLISHDLAQPLGVIFNLTEILQEDPSKLTTPRYREMLVTNVLHAVELVNSLRAYLRNPESRNGLSSFIEAHEHVIRLLGFQFSAGLMSGVRQEVDREHGSLRLQIGQSDLIHVLYNVYSNALENLRANDVENPALVITSTMDTDGKARAIAWNRLG